MKRLSTIARSENQPEYEVDRTDYEHIAESLRRLETRLRKAGQSFASPIDVKSYCVLKLAELEHEVFCCVFLDAQHRLIEFVEMFRGTVTQTSVYPREVVKAALARNAVALIFAHNHPSGMPEPSRADEYLTSTLKTACALVDVRMLDHVIVGGVQTVSFAERGLL